MRKEQNITYALNIILAAANVICALIYLFSGLQIIPALLHFTVAISLIIMLYIFKKRDDNVTSLIEDMLANNETVGVYKELKLETMVIPINSTIVLWYDDNISFEQVKSAFTDVTTAFPNNVVVALPEQTTLESYNLDELKNIQDVINQAVDYATTAKQKPVDLNKEVVTE